VRWTAAFVPTARVSCAWRGYGGGRLARIRAPSHTDPG
jgi:hypothetical protein